MRLFVDAVNISGIGIVAATTANQIAQFIAAVLFYLLLRCFDYWREKRKGKK